MEIEVKVRKRPLKCCVCENPISIKEPCIELTWKDSKKKYFYHIKCHIAEKKFEKLRAEGKKIPYYYKFLRQEGINLNPNMFKIKEDTHKID